MDNSDPVVSPHRTSDSLRELKEAIAALQTGSISLKNHLLVESSRVRPDATQVRPDAFQVRHGGFQLPLDLAHTRPEYMMRYSTPDPPSVRNYVRAVEDIYIDAMADFERNTFRRIRQIERYYWP